MRRNSSCRVEGPPSLLTCFVLVGPLRSIWRETVRSVRHVWCSGEWCLLLWLPVNRPPSASAIPTWPPRIDTGLFSFACALTVCSATFQAVEELLESLELEKSNYHMGLSRVSLVKHMPHFIPLCWDEAWKTFMGIKQLNPRGEKASSISELWAKFKEVQCLEMWISIKWIQHHIISCHLY